MSNYIIVTPRMRPGYSMLSSLAEEVNKKIDEGYIPIGGLAYETSASITHTIVQAMVKKAVHERRA